VNLSEFPDLGKFDLRRSISVSNVDASGLAEQATNIINNETQNAANSASQISATAQTAVSEASEQVTALASTLKGSIPDYYSIGLWGYCQGRHDAASFSNCSAPSMTFTFDLLKVFGSLSGEIDDLIPSKGKSLLAGSRHLSEWTTSAYVIGTITLAFALVFGITTMAFSWGKIPLILCSLVRTSRNHLCTI
jgi:hypothetical protein